MSLLPTEKVRIRPAVKPEIESLLVTAHISVKEAMRQIGRGAEKILFVVDERNRLLGSLSDGDIRRWVLSDGNLADTIERVYNKHPVFLREEDRPEEAKRLMLAHKIEWIPVVDEEGMISNVLLWDAVFAGEMKRPRSRLALPVVIMAGGKGTRLDPFTRILPKPLIPIGDKAVIEIIMERFHQSGVEEFYVSINHRSKMIKAYFEEANLSYKIHYIEEKKPLGTGGSLRYLKDCSHKILIISNCDILVECDYQEILDFHEAKGCDITIVGSFRHFSVPYGVCVIENGGTLSRIEEKPEFDYLVNTGMYVMNRDALRWIPEDQSFPITDLIHAAKSGGGKVGVFPIPEKSWIDIGEWEEYRRAKRILEMET
jgi:dTDP-glucose pyrophosphorylase/CBS domain-containing protein